MQSKRSMASATVIPNRTDLHGVAEVYIGGAADSQSRIVVSYVEARQRAIRESAAQGSRTAAWFAHYDLDGVAAHCRAALAHGNEIALIGHSWGSDTALRVAHQLRGPVALMAGVDPVMRPGGLFSRTSDRPDDVRLVIHVDARPQQFDRSDFVKATGVVLGGGLANAYRTADVRIRTELNHWAFAGMMSCKGADGVSVADQISRAEWRRRTSRAG
jgi:pimeloyl-ACP methyl ester carboxylesterase